MALEDGLRELFTARGAEDPAVEEVLLRSVLEGVIFKTAVYGAQYPTEPIRRMYALYALPGSETELPLPAGPPRSD